MSELYELAVSMVRSQAALKGHKPMATKLHPADLIWSEMMSLRRECEQLDSQRAALGSQRASKERRMQALADRLKAMAKDKNLPGLA